MDDVNSDFIERYQKLYEEDPKSRIFAPLAEAYRKMGLIDEALELAEKGVKLHPHFPGGRVALGRLYAQLEKHDMAETEFRKAIEFSPENILAHQLLAETCLKLKKTKAALRAYKMLLFLSPDNERALTAVRKLESLTADEYEEEIFAMKPLKEAMKEWTDFDLEPPEANTQDSMSKAEEQKHKFLDRVLSLADAYIVRSDIDRALEALNEAERLVGPNPEIIKRLKLIHHRELDAIPHPKISAEIPRATTKNSTVAERQVDQQIDFLQDLLQKIKQRDI